MSHRGGWCHTGVSCLMNIGDHNRTRTTAAAAGSRGASPDTLDLGWAVFTGGGGEEKHISNLTFPFLLIVSLNLDGLKIIKNV